jgi:hypothetical protein
MCQQQIPNWEILVRSSFLKRLVSGGGTLVLALSGAVVLTASPASAKTVVTDYGFEATSFGTRVVSNSASLNTGRLAHAWISCTRLAGLNGSNRPQAANYLAASDAPQNNPLVQLGTMESSNRTFRNKTKHLVGVTSVHKLSSVTLKGPAQDGVPGPVFSLKGLTTTSTAFAKNGVLDANSAFTSAELSLDLPTGTPIDEPLAQLLGALNGGIGTVISTVQQAAGQEIEIPGLGIVRPGATDKSVHKNSAGARAYALVVELFGQDGTRGTDDDSVVTLGKTRAHITRGLPAGVMNGYGYGLDAKVADGLLKIGETGIQPLDCQGTNGVTVSTEAKPANDLLDGLLDVGTMLGFVNGLQNTDGTARAWTMGKVSGVSLGEGDQHVEIEGIVGKANVRKKANGTVVRNIKGTGIGSLTIGSQTFTADQVPSEPITVDGLGTLEFNVVKSTKRGVRVTAVRITVHPGEANETVINLGNARAFIQPY